LPQVLKVLGQVTPAATTATDLYTVPASTQTTVSTVTICNRAGTSASFRLYVRVAGVAIDNKQYIYYDQPIDGNSTFALTLGVTLAATDKLSVYASTANLSFNAFGVELS
jgi:hypothetical protein